MEQAQQKIDTIEAIRKLRREIKGKPATDTTEYLANPRFQKLGLMGELVI